MVESKTIVIGHKNPDTDSCAAAVGYAELKRIMGNENVIAASAGFPGSRTEFLFNKFNVPMPKVIEDVRPRVEDVMNTSPVVVYQGQTLLEAMEYIKDSQMSRLPVINDQGIFLGMVSLFDLAERMFQKDRSSGFDEDGEGVISRGVNTSIALAAKTLNARVSSLGCDENDISEHNVYVGAMSLERLKTDVLKGNSGNLVVVVGDRSDVHEALVDAGIYMMIVTGSAGIDLDLIRKAKENGTTILQTPFDSATAVRRLKFSQPVELMKQKEVTVLSARNKLSDIYRQLMSKMAENFPVCDSDNMLLGALTKADLDQEPPVNLVLVDHNELDHAVKGASEVPVIEIMDHHRLGISPTDKPIVVTNDVVGSTSTLVVEQYRKFGYDPSPEIAGILMGGVVTDTLYLRSPTSTERDKIAIEYLEKLCGVKAKTLLDEIFSVGSVIANQTQKKVVSQDKKNYKTDIFSFSVSQVEESGFENFEASKEALFSELVNIVESEGMDFAALLVTDVVYENSLLLVAGRQKIINALPFSKINDNLFDLPDILSRKKQLLPTLLKAFEKV